MKGGAFNFFKVNDFPQDDKQLKQDAEEQLKQWARVDDFIVTTETTSLNALEGTCYTVPVWPGEVASCPGRVPVPCA